MASSKEYLGFVLDRLSGLSDVSYRPMMGEFVLYYREKVVGGIYDDRFLVKLTPASRRLMPSASLELPYEGAKEMIRVDDEKNAEFLKELLGAMVDELPAPRKKRSLK